MRSPGAGAAARRTSRTGLTRSEDPIPGALDDLQGAVFRSVIEPDIVQHVIEPTPVLLDVAHLLRREVHALEEHQQLPDVDAAEVDSVAVALVGDHDGL